MVVLYRRYRPQNFDTIIGQPNVSNLLKNAVSTKAISHAYIFIGPRGTGKTTTARVLAKAVNCQKINKDGNPCGQCTVCTTVESGRFVDLIEIDAASNRGIDEIRQLRERIEFAPGLGQYKVYIIDEVHMLTKEAFNALLKTLEEPPKHVIFILATTEPHKVPATILSRCQRYEFKLGTPQDLKTQLDQVLKEEGLDIMDSARDLIIKSAAGSYRDALSLLDMVVTGVKSDSQAKKALITEDFVRTALGLPDETMIFYFLEKLMTAESGEAISMVHEIEAKGVNLHQFVRETILKLREVLVSILDRKTLPEGYDFMTKINQEKLMYLISYFMEADKELKTALVPTLPLEMVVAKFRLLLDPVGEIEEESSNPIVSLKSKNEEKGQSQTQSIKNKLEKVVKPVATKVEKSVPVIKGKAGKSQTEALTLKEIKAKWADFINGLRPYNGHLFAFLIRGQLKDVGLLEEKGNQVNVVVRYNFHKERIESMTSQKIIQKVAKAVYGQPFYIVCEIGEVDPLKTDIKLAKRAAALNNQTVSNSEEEGVSPTLRSNSGPAAQAHQDMAVFNEVFGEMAE